MVTCCEGATLLKISSNGESVVQYTCTECLGVVLEGTVGTTNKPNANTSISKDIEKCSCGATMYASVSMLTCGVWHNKYRCPICQATRDVN